MVVSGAGRLTGTAFVRAFDTVIVVRAAETVTAHAVMRAVLFGTRGLAFTGGERFEVGRCTEDVIESIGITVMTRGLARTAFFRSGDTTLVELGAQVRSTHAVVRSEQIGTRALAFTGITERRRFTEDVINTFLVILRACGLARTTLVCSGDTIIVVLGA